MASLKKEPSLKTKDVELRVLNFILRESNFLLGVPRCESMGFEADVLGLTKTAFLHEFEIKISRSDFLQDKKKEKWYPKHLEKLANYFWYVCPNGMIKQDEIPEWAGLLYVDSRKIPLVVRAPKRLSKRKANPQIFRRMARSLNYKLLKFYSEIGQ